MFVWDTQEPIEARNVDEYNLETNKEVYTHGFTHDWYLSHCTWNF